MSQPILAASQRDFDDYCKSNKVHGFRIKRIMDVPGLRGDIIVTERAHLGDSYKDTIDLLRESESFGLIKLVAAPMTEPAGLYPRCDGKNSVSMQYWIWIDDRKKNQDVQFCDVQVQLRSDEATESRKEKE